MEGSRPVGRSKKSWSKVVEEDTRKLNIMEDVAQDRYQVQIQEWETKDIKQRRRRR